MDLQVKLHLTEAEFELWHSYAIRCTSFKRDDPRKRWTKTERAQAVRFAMTTALQDLTAAIKRKRGQAESIQP